MPLLLIFIILLVIKVSGLLFIPWWVVFIPLYIVAAFLGLALVFLLVAVLCGQPVTFRWRRKR